MANLQCQVDILSKAIVKQHINSDNMNLNAVEQKYRYITYNGKRIDETQPGSQKTKIKFDFTNYDEVSTGITNSLDLTFGKSLTNNGHKNPRFYTQKKDDTYKDDSQHTSLLVHTDSDETCIDGYIIGTTKSTTVENDQDYKCFNLIDNCSIIGNTTDKFKINIGNILFTVNEIKGRFSTEPGDNNTKKVMNGESESYKILIIHDSSFNTLGFEIRDIPGHPLTGFKLNDVKFEQIDNRDCFTYCGKEIINVTLNASSEQQNTSDITISDISVDFCEIKTINNENSFVFIGENGELIASSIEGEKQILILEIDSNLTTYSQLIKVIDSNRNEYRNGDSSKAFSVIQLSYSTTP